MLSEMFFVDHYRAPFYSLFLPLVVNLAGGNGALIRTPVFFEKAFFVIAIQMVFGVAGMLLLYRSLEILKLNYKFRVFLVLFLVTNLIIFSWERLLLTESLATFFLIMTFYLTVKILLNPKAVHFFWYLLIAVCALMLRPFSIGMPLIPLLIIIFYHKKKSVILLSIAVILLYGSVIKTYSTLNFKRFQFYGLSRAGDINALGKILLYRLPLEAGKNEKFTYDRVSDYTSLPRDPHPFRFLEQYNLQFEESVPDLLELKTFSRKVITASLSLYLLKSTEELPGGLASVSEKIMVPPAGANLESKILNIGFMISRYMQYVFFLIFIFFPVSIFSFIRKPTEKSAAMLVAGCVSFYQILFSVYIAHGEYGRLIVPAQPMIYLFSLYYLKVTVVNLPSLFKNTHKK